MAAEIFPQRLRGKGLTLTTAASWLTTFAIARAVPLMIQRRHVRLLCRVISDGVIMVIVISTPIDLL